jgi:hypothetical protein
MVAEMLRYQRDPSIVSRDIAGETILVPIRKNTGDLENIYTLNPTAASVWKLIDGQRTQQEICEQIVSEYEVGMEQAGQDLHELLLQLIEIGAVVEV